MDAEEQIIEKIEQQEHKKGKRRIYVAVSTLILIFIFGTVSYHNIEGWSWVDSFYFVGITLTTIGYGDLYPITAAGRVFTVFFAIIGVALTLFILTAIAEEYFTRRMEQANRLESMINKENIGKIMQLDKLERMIPKKDLAKIKEGLIGNKEDYFSAMNKDAKK